MAKGGMVGYRLSIPVVRIRTCDVFIFFYCVFEFANYSFWNHRSRCGTLVARCETLVARSGTIIIGLELWLLTLEPS